MKKRTKVLLGLSPLFLVLLFIIVGLVRFMSFGLPLRVFEAPVLGTSGSRDGRWVGEGAVTPPFGTLVAFRKARVALEIKDGRITSVEVLEPKGVEKELGGFRQSVLDRQGSGVEVVSGATWTTGAARKAVADALAKSKAP
jgi:uncharacterized protein with FMN-binding domain